MSPRRSGAELVRWRQRWAVNAAKQFEAEFDCLGESGRARLHYRGPAELAEPEAWAAALATRQRKIGPGE